MADAAPYTNTRSHEMGLLPQPTTVVATYECICHKRKYAIYLFINDTQDARQRALFSFIPFIGKCTWRMNNSTMREKYLKKRLILYNYCCAKHTHTAPF